MLQQHIDMMTEPDLDNWIRGLVDDQVPENIRLDYKAEPNYGPASNKKELVKDVTSFANEIGGNDHIRGA